MVKASDTAADIPAMGLSSADDQASEGTQATRSLGFASRDVVPVLAIAAGVASGISGQQPTGNSAADFVLPFVFGAGAVWISQFAKPQAVLVSAVLTLFFSGLQMPAVLMGAAAVASIGFVSSWRPFDADSVIIGGALAAGFASQAALNLPSIRFVGSASLMAAVSLAPIVVSALKGMPGPLRRRVVRGAFAVAAFAIIATGLAVFAALGVRNHVETGITQAEDGVTALEAGDQPQAVALLQASKENFELASNRLGGPMTWPARFVPITAQHSRALETAADQGVALAQTAARTVTQADVEKIRGRNGQIDLAIVDAVNAELTLANDTLRESQRSLIDVNTPWLLPLLSSRLESVQAELEATAADIDLANHATTVLPRMLGAQGERRYLVLFVQPAESREFGGFVGAYGVLEVDQGRFDLAESGSIDVDLGTGDATFADTGAYPRTLLETAPHISPQNSTATPDLPTIAALLEELVPQWRRNPDFTIDGVITIDPYALAGLLELTGPVQIEGRDAPLDATNVVDFLLRGQYLEFEDAGREVRQDVLKVLAAEAFDQVFKVDIPGPERLGAIFGPVARANRLSFVTFDDAENAFLDRIYLSAAFPEVGSAVEMFGLYGQTGTASKLDAYATRSISYDVVVDPATGQVTGTAEIIERNDAPPDADRFVLGAGMDGPNGEPLGVGSNFVALGLYTRGDVQSFDASTPFSVADVTDAYSYQRHRVFYEVPLGGQARVSFDVTNQVEPGRYDLFIPAQATAAPTEFTLRVQPTPGWRIVDNPSSETTWSETFVLDQARGLTFVFEPTN